MRTALFAFAGLLLISTGASGQAVKATPLIPGDQVAVSIADTWNSVTGKLWLLDKQNNGEWKVSNGPWRVIYGKNGLAWGIGINPPQKGIQKVERDKRAPAGIFKIGTVYSNQAKPLKGAENWPFYQVTTSDAWIDNPKLPNYNHIIRINPANPPAWFKDQRMKPEDPTYTWRILIEHNYPDAKPGMGSAIFFHFQRGENIPSAGCTVMPVNNIETLLRWLDPAGKPVLVQLPQEEYIRLSKSWGLPDPKLLGL